jgi:hypothetical protein
MLPGDDAEDDDGGSHRVAVDAGSLPYDTDVGSPPKPDAATTPPSSDAGGGTADTSTPETSHVVPHESGAGDVAVPSDAGLGASCTTPIDISDGGTFAIDTCTLIDSVAASCGTTAAAAILRGVAPTSGSTYELTFPSGWVLQQLDGTCSPMTYSCGDTGTWSVSGDTPDGYWYFAIEPASGTCGSASVTVDRVM